MGEPPTYLLEIQKGFGRDAARRAGPLGPLVAQLQDAVEYLLAKVQDLEANSSMSNISDLKDEVEAVTTGLLDRVTALETAGDPDFGTKQIPLSFESNEQGAMKVYFAQRSTVNRIRYFVTSQLAKNNVGTVTAKDSAGTSMTGGAVSIPALSIYGTEAAAVPTDHNVCNAGDFIQLVTAKAAPGGTVLATIEYTITP